MQTIINDIITLVALAIWFWPTTLIICLVIWALTSTLRVVLSPIWAALKWVFKMCDKWD